MGGEGERRGLLLSVWLGLTFEVVVFWVEVAVGVEV